MSKQDPENRERQKAIDDYILRQQRKLEASANQSSRDANETFRELSRQLMFLAVGIITFTSVFLDDLATLEKAERLKLFASWLCFAASLFFGIIQYITDNLFYQKMSELHIRAVRFVAKRRYKTIRDMVNGINAIYGKKLKHESWDFPMAMQIMLILLGMYFFLWFSSPIALGP